MKEERKLKREERRREKEERKRREKEEKARLKAEKKELRERRKREKREAAEELLELPDLEAAVEGASITATREGAEEAAPLPDAVTTAESAEPATKATQAAMAPLPEAPEEVVVPESEAAREFPEGAEGKEGWLSRLRRGLSRSRTNIFAPLARAMASRRFDEAFWEEVEDILVGADVGMEMTIHLVDRVKERVVREDLREPEELMAAFREEVAELLDQGDRTLRYAASGPSVFLVVGVNGTGKTTTIAKLAHLLRKEGKRVILAAGDTFRAAGIEQLETWGQRVGVHTVKHRQGADAAAVVHDAVEAALARGMDVVIADTAGRLHTKVNLMEELKKIKRVAERRAPVTETLLVIDATTGQNGLIQARQFKEAVEVTGVVLTKLDGTAKGGIVVAIAHELGIPIKFIGVGEKLDDLHPFDPREFAEALFS
ncbi:signal recognition particle-docking protein FtsY [Candidatus Solincola sp.]|jgi:fused signal recognition particle receptor|nr:signal recognition particle-docking protein FtsY [Actinomycetota bacterium]MDI7252713.1 signal recognition particle-docking protein FtsY [Actinomycetota bacterium]